MPYANASATPVDHHWDEIGERWTEQRRDPVWRAHSDEVYVRLLERWLPSGRRRVLKTDLFDEAVADGVYPAVQRLTGTIVGFDVASRVTATACNRYPRLRGIVADARQLPFDDGAFDTVISLSSLDHFPVRDDIRRSLLELHRVMTPDGRLIVTLDNLTNPIVALRNRVPHRLLHALRLVPYRMGMTYTGRALVSLLRACRFDVEDVTYVVHCPRVVAVVIARLVERTESAALRAAFLRSLTRCERLAKSPIAALTGYYTAALARKR